MTALLSPQIADIFAEAFAKAIPRKPRGLRQWAEEECYTPEGPYEGLPFRADRQPFMALAFDEIDRGDYRRHSFVGCVQSGKSLGFWVLPQCHAVFELGETSVSGVPDMNNTAADKWRKEILPVIQLTRYRELLPTKGRGSKGGTPESVDFQNGRTLKFMSGTGGDAKRSSFTAKNAFMTEVDKYDQAGGASREGPPVEQIEARTLAYGSEGRVWLECTASIETGRIWMEYINGTATRVVIQCPHCRHWWTPEREHLKGWEDAGTAKEAGRLAYWECPECEGQHGEKERKTANKRAKLLHAGQEIDDDGTITGEAPDVETFSFRWNAYNNLFWTTADIAAKHWTVSRGIDEEEDEKSLLQFWWAKPFQPREEDLAPINVEELKERTSTFPQRQVPPGAVALSAGVDIGKYLFHYVVIAWMEDGTGYVVDYDLIEADADRLGTKRAAEVALLELRDVMLAGYPVHGSGDVMVPGQVWIDSGWKDTKEEVYAFCRRKDTKGRFYPAKGYSYLQQTDRAYRQPTKKTQDVRMIGREYHASRQREHRVDLIHVNGDHWKTEVRDAFGKPADQAGALVLFTATQNAHTKYAKHIEAERPKLVYVEDRGEVTVWERVSRRNHYLDATYLATASGHRAVYLHKHPPAKPVNPWEQSKRRGRRR